MIRLTTWSAATALTGILAFGGSPAFAQGTRATVPAAPPAAVPIAGSADATERARAHYLAGLKLFEEGAYDPALFEFERAYELAPSYKILYNMGRIQREQNNYAAAIRSYTRYLLGPAVPADRRSEVAAELAALKPRVAHVRVTVNVDAADVYADDIPVCTATIESSCVGKSPLQAPIIVNGGRHKITATKNGYVSATSIISVVGTDEIDVKLELQSVTPPPPPPKNAWVLPAVLGWSATGAAGVTAIITGVMAMKARDEQETKVASLNADRGDLDRAQDKTRTLAGVTDLMLISTGVFAIASTYLTVRMIGAGRMKVDPAKAAAARPVDVSFSPTGVAAFGTF